MFWLVRLFSINLLGMHVNAYSKKYQYKVTENDEI